MSEKEGDHRRALQIRVAESAIATERRAQTFGFVAVMTTTVMGGVLLVLGVPAVGVTMVISSLVALVAGGIWNRYAERKQLQLEERQLKANEEATRSKEAKDGKKGKKK